MISLVKMTLNSNENVLFLKAKKLLLSWGVIFFEFSSVLLIFIIKNNNMPNRILDPCRGLIHLSCP